MNILIIGGGPAGLLFAYLMKKRAPEHRVRVLEQNPRDATYGFGVGLAEGGMKQLQAADAELHERLVGALRYTTAQEFRFAGESVWFDRLKPSGAISRMALLQTLQALCEAVGVDIRHDQRCIDLAAAAAGADLVVGADGANSIVRSADTEGFGTRVSHLTNRLAWYGTRRVNPHAMLSFKHARGGVFIGHFYPYAADMSTFVAECDERTWRGLGLEALDADERRALAEDVFAEELGGHPLLENKSVWRAFPVVTNERWFAGRHVLMGDALRTVHPSIGSGTRLAFEDALALWQVLERPPADAEGLQAALADYVRIRRPAMDKLADAARRSNLWYEDIRDKMDRMDVLELGHDFLMRTGRITPERLRQEFPRFVAQWEARHGALAVSGGGMA